MRESDVEESGEDTDNGGYLSLEEDDAFLTRSLFKDFDDASSTLGNDEEHEQRMRLLAHDQLREKATTTTRN